MLTPQQLIALLAQETLEATPLPSGHYRVVRLRPKHFFLRGPVWRGIETLSYSFPVRYDVVNRRWPAPALQAGATYYCDW